MTQSPTRSCVAPVFNRCGHRLKTGATYGQRAAVLVLCGGLALFPGCVQRATVHLVPAEATKLDRRRPLVQTFHPPAAYHWVDRSGELCLALSQDGRTAGRSFDLSLVLDGPPAGTGRTYSVTRRTLRAVLRDDQATRRYGSYRGLVRVELDPTDPAKLIGRFRIWANEQEYKFWMDFWTGDQEVLLAGEFHAVRDPNRGRPILIRTESEELQRGPPEALPRPVVGPPIKD